VSDRIAAIVIDDVINLKTERFRTYFHEILKD
jgi:hypothetical protein